jgi:hypothetical protein
MEVLEGRMIFYLDFKEIILSAATTRCSFCEDVYMVLPSVSPLSPYSQSLGIITLSLKQKNSQRRTSPLHRTHAAYRDLQSAVLPRYVSRWKWEHAWVFDVYEGFL